MYQFIYDILTRTGLNNYISAIVYAVCIIAGIIICIFLKLLITGILTKIFSKINKRKKILWIEASLESRLFKRTSNIIIPIVIYMFTFDIPERHIFWDKAVEISLVIIALLLLHSLIKIISRVYGSCDVSKHFPIRGILQVIEIAIFIIGGIIVISSIVDRNPAMLLGSIGAVTAVTSIVFKDAILGFAAGIQLTANGMIKIGDRIELPKRSANGIIIDLSMMTVTIENFDKTTTAIPAYTLITEEFINWRDVIDTGARRIKRQLFIDATGIRICDDDMIEKFKKIYLIRDYINNKLADIEQSNKRLDCDMSEKTNGRRMTNIGVFRAYITAYLMQHSGIRHDLSLVTRQLETDGKGIPLEIYAFANTAILTEFENIQSDIFDHLYAVISEFGLTLYQSPSSGDIRQITKL